MGVGREEGWVRLSSRAVGYVSGGVKWKWGKEWGRVGMAGKKREGRTYNQHT